MKSATSVRRPYEKPLFSVSALLAQVTAAAPVSALKVPSDRRLKTEVQLLDVMNNGIKLYSYRYIWSSDIQVGVMAQDLLGTEHAHAVTLADSGFYVVDYAALGLHLPVALAEWSGRRPYARPTIDRRATLASIAAGTPVSGLNPA